MTPEQRLAANIVGQSIPQKSRLRKPILARARETLSFIRNSGGPPASQAVILAHPPPHSIMGV
jgi:hypothetical protein